jgi:hypothetical protein
VHYLPGYEISGISHNSCTAFELFQMRPDSRRLLEIEVCQRKEETSRCDSQLSRWMLSWWHLPNWVRWHRISILPADQNDSIDRWIGIWILYWMRVWWGISISICWQAIGWEVSRQRAPHVPGTYLEPTLEADREGWARLF